jgi:hypothetical protein
MWYRGLGGHCLGHFCIYIYFFQNKNKFWQQCFSRVFFYNTFNSAKKYFGPHTWTAGVHGRYFGVAYFKSLSVAGLYEVTWYDRWIRKDLERNDSCLFEILSRYWSERPRSG